MGFFDTITDIFTGDPAKEAAAQNKQQLAQYQAQAEAAQKTGYATGTENLGKAIGAYDPLTTLAGKYGAAGDLYLDALGVNGPEGIARATKSFQTSPGYELTKTADLEALARSRASRGMYNSGGMDTDVMNYITKALYGTQYQPWLAGLQQAGVQGQQAATTAAGGRAAGYGGLASLAGKYADTLSNIYGNVTQGNIAANNQIAEAEMAGSKNLWGVGLSLASMAAGMPGGGSGLLGGGGGGAGTVYGASPTYKMSGGLFGSGPTSLGGYTGPTPFY